MGLPCLAGRLHTDNSWRLSDALNRSIFLVDRKQRLTSFQNFLIVAIYATPLCTIMCPLKQILVHPKGHLEIWWFETSPTFRDQKTTRITSSLLPRKLLSSVSPHSDQMHFELESHIPVLHSSCLEKAERTEFVTICGGSCRFGVEMVRVYFALTSKRRRTTLLTSSVAILLRQLQTWTSDGCCNLFVMSERREVPVTDFLATYSWQAQTFSTRAGNTGLLC
jgi:hypothetical protein